MQRIINVFLLCMVFLVGSASAQSGGQIQWDTIPERTRQELHKAQQLMNENKFEQAINKLLKFQKRKKKYNHFLIEFNIGTAYGFLGDFKNAILHLEKATELNETYAPLWLNLGKLYYQIKEFAKSADALEKGFHFSIRKEPEILYMAMAAYYQAGVLEKTIEVGEELVTTYRRETFEVVSLLANAYITLENNEGAINMLNRLLERNPGNEKVWKLISQAYFKNQQYREATLAYETYGYLNGFSREELMIMGDLFTMVGIPLRAAQYYASALNNGGSAEEYEKMSVAYYSAYEFEEAISALDKALTEQNTAERLLLKAQLYYLQDKFGDAQKFYTLAAEIMSKDGHEWLMAGYCAMRNGAIPIARELLQRATEFAPQRNEALALLKMLTPVEEVKNLMAHYKEENQTVNH